MEGSGRERRVGGCGRPKRGLARGRTASIAVVMTKRPTARTRHPSRPLRGRVDVEPPSATGETARCRSGADEEKRVLPGLRNQQQRGSIVPPHGGRQMSWYSHGGCARRHMPQGGFVWGQDCCRNIQGRVCEYHALVYPGSELSGEITPLLLHV